MGIPLRFGRLFFCSPFGSEPAPWESIHFCPGWSLFRVFYLSVGISAQDAMAKCGGTSRSHGRLGVKVGTPLRYRVPLPSPVATPEAGFLRSEGPAAPQGATSQGPEVLAVCPDQSDGTGRSSSLLSAARVIAEDPVAREQAAITFEDNFLTPGSRSSQESKLNTLATLASAAGLQLFPLSLGTLRILGGVLAAAGYASGETYLRCARVRHVQLGFPLPEEIKLWFKGVERSLCRNRGPQKRAATLDPRTLLLEVPTGMLRISVTPGSAWPVLVWESLVMAIWWMLQHAELAALTGEVLLIFPDTQEAELRLGVTKTDVAGRGCRRRFACCCREGIPPLLCPFHVAHRVAAQAALRQAGATDLLFCAALGCPPTQSGTL